MQRFECQIDENSKKFLNFLSKSTKMKSKICFLNKRLKYQSKLTDLCTY